MPPLQKVPDHGNSSPAKGEVQGHSIRIVKTENEPTFASYDRLLSPVSSGCDNNDIRYSQSQLSSGSDEQWRGGLALKQMARRPRKTHPLYELSNQPVNPRQDPGD